MLCLTYFIERSMEPSLPDCAGLGLSWLVVSFGLEARIWRDNAPDPGERWGG
jgi:hypothetical protein